MKKIISILLIVITLVLSLPAISVESNAVFEGQDKINIVLDPGHGGSSVGTSARGIGEKTYTLKLSLLIRDILVKNGNFNVYLTRTGDAELELYQRAEIANNCNADLLISIHFDGSQNSSENGVTAYTSIFDDYALVSLSQSIAQNVSSSIGLYNNGVRRRVDNAGYYWNFERQWDCQDPSLGTLSDYYGIPTWCAKFGISSTIIEHGFFSNYADAEKIFTTGNLEKMAEAEAKAIIDYFTNHTHNYGNAEQDFPSNCMYTGKTSQHCTVCGHRINVKLLAPAPDNHYWVEKETTASSCGTDGKTVLECRITENLIDKGWEGELHTKTETVPAPKDHAYELLSEVPATHTEDGYKKWRCTSCKYEYTEELKAEGHTFGDAEYKEPTCTEAGGYTYKCISCSHSYTEEVPATGHKFVSTETVDPTCTEAGNKSAKCSSCDFVHTETVAALGHAYTVSEEILPTCTEDGHKTQTCTRCNEVINEVLDKTGHTYKKEDIVPANCTKDGSTIYVCTSCQDKKEETIPKLGHDLKHTVSVEPTCTTGGKEITSCTRCEFTESKDIEPLGHKKSAHGITVKEATLFTSGTKKHLCENGCSYTFQETVPPKLDTTHKIMLICAFAVVFSALIIAVTIIIVNNKKVKNVAQKNETVETKTKEEENAAV